MKAQRSEPDRRHFLGIHVDPLTIDETVARCVKAVEERSPITIGVLNAAKIVRLRKDPPLSRAVLGCDLVLADGQSVVWAAGLLRRPLPERVAGIDLMLSLLPEAERRGHSVFFLGARQEVLDRTVAEILRRFPRLTVAGSRHGYFSSAEAPEVVRRQLTSNAELIGNLGERLREQPPTGVVTFARGSSDHAATFAKYLIETRAKTLTTSAAPSITSVYITAPQYRGTLALTISQSGRSPDIIAATAVARGDRRADEPALLVLGGDRHSGQPGAVGAGHLPTQGRIGELRPGLCGKSE